MWPLDLPRHLPGRSYETCISRTREMGTERRRTRLNDAASAIEKAARSFRRAAASQDLHQLKEDDFKVPGVSDRNAIDWIYKNGMVDKRSPGRAIYDDLMDAAEDERCPLCGWGRVSQLDHFVPKSSFPALCVDPLNLIPACGECNRTKGEYWSADVSGTLLHPYLDRVDGDQWLDARVIHEAPLRLAFFVTVPPTWGDVLAARVHHHFNRFGLAKLYASQANRTLRNIQQSLEGQLRAGGGAMVRAYLLDAAASRLAVEYNGWEGVTYRTLAADDAFCRGAFLR